MTATSQPHHSVCDDQPSKLPHGADTLHCSGNRLYVHSFNGHLLSAYYVPGTRLWGQKDGQSNSVGAETRRERMYGGPLNNAGLNGMGPLIFTHIFFNSKYDSTMWSMVG